MDAARKPALGDSTNAPQQPAAKSPPRPAADERPRAVVTWYHPDQLPPPPAAELLRPAPPAAPPAAPPKESSSAFVFFGRATRDDIKAAHPDWSLGDVGRELSKRWKALDDAAKKPFHELAAADKERYEREKADYEAANPPPPVVAAKSAPPAPPPRKRPAPRRPPPPKRSRKKSGSDDDSDFAPDSDDEDDDSEIEDAPDATEVVAEVEAVVPRAKKAESRRLAPSQIMELPPTDPRRMALQAVVSGDYEAVDLRALARSYPCAAAIVAKKKADAVVYEAALNDFVRRHDLWEKKCNGRKTYKEIFFAIEDRVAAGKGSGSNKGTAANWLCRLMRHTGDPERTTPSDVRHWMRHDPPKRR